MKKRGKKETLRVSLALGGGGARGFAHIGILKTLEKNKIDISAIAGTSFGSIIGGLYALCLDAVAVEKRSFDFLSSPLFNKMKTNYLKGMAKERKRAGIGLISLSRPAFIHEAEYLDIMRSLAGNKSFEDTRIHFSTTATDIVNGKGIILNKGRLDVAFAASCSIPGIFPPVIYNNRLLVDGGWSAEVPVEAASMLEADIVIAVDTAEKMDEEIDPDSGLGILLRADTATRDILNAIQLKKADIILQPNLKGISWDSFHKAKEAVMAGEDAARKRLGEIKRLRS